MNEDRLIRLRRLEGIGDEGIDKLKNARIALVGCGTLGSAYAVNLVRMGVGYLRLIDRDIVEFHNLTAQILYDEEDVRSLLPKAVAAQKQLAKINSRSVLEAHPSDLHYRNAAELLSGVDIILDGTDNFDTRFLINDVALQYHIPWIYTGVVGFVGVCMPVIPGETACLRCLLDEPPESGTLPTCETAGVWAPAAQAIAAVGLTQMLNWITRKRVDPTLSEMDFSRGTWRKIKQEKTPDCPACGRRQFDFLSGRWTPQAIRLCGRNMVYLQPQKRQPLNLEKLAESLSPELPTTRSEYLLKVKTPEADIFIFSDGRAFIKGVSDVGRAKTIYHRYISP